jgi:pimeloyl-ACP methyl ester carboxylesterase
MNVVADTSAPMLEVSGIAVDVIERGRGRPLLFLHPGIGIERTAPVLDHLARNARVIAPSHPGFGRSEVARWMSTVDDLAYFYLDFLKVLDLRDTIVVGVSLGGWIAAEIAVKSTERLSHLVLANSVGIKVSDRETRDVVDIFAITEPEFNEIAYFDPRVGARDYPAMPDAEVQIVARNREATARFAWSPFMHNPKLKHRLHRIDIPTLFLWGANDRVLSEPYGRAFCAAIPDARFELIERAGHFPHLEQPEEFARRVFAFAGKPS